MLGDFHVHTLFSSDCEVDPQEYVDKALRLGMKEICFTENIIICSPPKRSRLKWA